jgi:hypothetical protein
MTRLAASVVITDERGRVLLIHEDYGEQTIDMVAGQPGSRMRGLQERFQWKGGISMRDWRADRRVRDHERGRREATRGVSLLAGSWAAT